MESQTIMYFYTQNEKDIIQRHLDTITKYVNFITSLNNKHIHKKINVRNKIVLDELIFYSDGTINSLCDAFNYILDNFKSHNSIFLTEYRLLRLKKKISVKRICRNSIKMISSIDKMKYILQIILKAQNNTATLGDKIIYTMMMQNKCG